MKTFYPFHDSAHIRDVVVHCSDPRFQEAFQSFIRDELKILHPTPIILPGGVSDVGVDMTHPHLMKAFREKVTLMLSLAEHPRLVLINHDGCKAYRAFHPKHTDISRKQHDDLRKAADFFALVSNVKDTEIYMARWDEAWPTDQSVYFEKI